MLALRLIMLPHVRIELGRDWYISTGELSSFSTECEWGNWAIQNPNTNRIIFLKSTRAKAHFCLPGREVFDARN